MVTIWCDEVLVNAMVMTILQFVSVTNQNLYTLNLMLYIYYTPFKMEEKERKRKKNAIRTQYFYCW